MKKTILAVVAIVLTLGVSTAFARTQILPLAVQEPVDFVTQQMWNAINLLQDQVNQFGSQTVQNTQRINELEWLPVAKNLKVYDANNQLVGYFTGTVGDIPIHMSSEHLLEVYDANRKEFIFIRKNGSIEPAGASAYYSTETWYSESNCEGTPYISNIEYQIVTPLFQGYYLTVSERSAIHLNVSNETSTIDAKSKKNSYQGCTATNVPGHVVRTFEYDPLNFTGPVEIRVE